MSFVFAALIKFMSDTSPISQHNPKSFLVPSVLDCVASRGQFMCGCWFVSATALTPVTYNQYIDSYLLSMLFDNLQSVLGVTAQFVPLQFVTSNLLALSFRGQQRVLGYCSLKIVAKENW